MRNEAMGRPGKQGGCGARKMRAWIRGQKDGCRDNTRMGDGWAEGSGMGEQVRRPGGGGGGRCNYKCGGAGRRSPSPIQVEAAAGPLPAEVKAGAATEPT